METIQEDVRTAIQQSLAEDVGPGDVTSNSIIPLEARMSGIIIAKESGVIAGLDVAAAVYREVDPRVDFRPAAAEGDLVQNGQTVAMISGPARALLTAERTALNFLGRMSGIATVTRQFVEAVAGTRAVILDTRKTAPGLRTLDKLAVRRGGGQNHRFGLYDMILIKDNHVDFAGSLPEAVRRARARRPDMELEVEARSLDDVRAALDCQVRRILLDNMSVESLAAAVALTKGAARLEASGNITLENVRRVAETGVDFISVGRLTHSARSLDLSFDYVR